MYSFPYEPYTVQKDLMAELYRCMDSSGVGVFESPTGTGKSLSVLCATLSWLEEHERETTQMLETQTVEEKEEEEAEGDWVEAYKKRKERDRKREEAVDELKRRERITKRIEEARKTVRRTQHTTYKKEPEEDQEDVLLNDNDDVPFEEEDDLGLHVTKIFYTSRTHSQLEQVAHELKKTRFTPRLVTLASRRVLCVNSHVKSLPPSLINERCMELRNNKNRENRKAGKKCARSELTTCPFYRKEAIEEVTDGILSTRLSSPHDVVESGNTVHGCSYLASRSSLPLCELVFLPYQVLLHEKTRASWGIRLEGNIVVIDEAHNVLQTIGRLYSCEVSGSQLTSSISAVRNYVNTYRLRLNPLNLKSLRLLLTILVPIERFLQSKKTVETLSTIEFLSQLQLHEVNMNELVRYMDRADLCRKLHWFSLRTTGNVVENKKGIEKLLAKKDDEKENQENGNKEIGAERERGVASALYVIKTLVEILAECREDGRIIVDPSSHCIRYIPMDSGRVLSGIARSARATLLVGGTMEPAQLLLSSLSEGSTRPVSRFSCPHIVSDQNVIALSIGMDANEKSLCLTHSNRGDPLVLDCLASIILKMLPLIPNGFVLFFPSYSFLGMFMAHCATNGTLDKFKMHKRIYSEKKESDGFEWNEYSRDARTSRGAVLFAVMNGRLSEGINFGDELGRCVAVIGMPYPNKESVELKEKMKYLDKQTAGHGQLLYESLCWHSINQAVGRAVRHKEDWACILLIDSRFRNTETKKKLSKWISNRLTHPPNFASAISSINDFYEKKTQKATE